MATDFIVKVVKIDAIHVHPKADKLEIAQIAGWQCIVQKNAYQVGNLAVYIPIDSVLPDKVERVLFGPDSKIKLSKSRVKSIKIRGAVSQGMLAQCETLGVPSKEGYDCTKELGISKYEPPEVPSHLGGGPNQSKKPPKKNPYFKEYGGLDNFKNYPDLFQEGEEVVITEKIHGCLESKTLIQFVDGTTKTIREIVENKIRGEVWGVDESGRMIPTRIINWFDNGKTNEWKCLKFTRNKVGKGNSYGRIVCTPNHRFLNPRTNQYIRSDELRVGDKLLVSRNDVELSYVQRSILVGKMLGDATYSNRSVSFGHKKDHEEYIDETLKALGIIAGNKQKEQLSGFGTVMARARTISSYVIENEFLPWLTTGNKEVPDGIQLNPITLAYWYMDDGSLGHLEDQEDRAYFATCAFSNSSIDNLLAALKNLGIDGVKSSTEDYDRIRLNADEAEKLFVLIAPYVVPCMRYKLPERYRDVPFVSLTSSNKYKEVLVEQEVLSIEDAVPGQIPSHTRYDIETETHNFIANGVVVHNSNFRFGWVPAQADTLTKKVKKLFGRFPDYEFVFGSNKVQLQNRVSSGNWKAKMLGWIPIKAIRTVAYQGYYQQSGVGNVYEEAVKKYDLKERTKNYEGLVFYGEIYGSSIQKGYMYGCAEGERKFIGFDIMNSNKDGTPFFYSHSAAEEIFRNIGLDVVPVLFHGAFNAEHAKKLTVGNSVLAPTQKVREGVVIRPTTEQKSHIGRKVLKLISDEYLLGDNTDFH